MREGKKGGEKPGGWGGEQRIVMERRAEGVKATGRLWHGTLTWGCIAIMRRVSTEYGACHVVPYELMRSSISPDSLF